MENVVGQKDKQILQVLVHVTAPVSICWRVRVGTRVQKNQILGYVSTLAHDSSVNIRATCSGRLVALCYPNGIIAEGTNSSSELCVCLLQEEPCQHLALIESLCVECGAEALVSQEGSQPGSSVYTSTLGFVASGRDFHTTHDFARRLEVEKIITLLRTEKLPLVLDLDNTLLHAYPIITPEDADTFFKERNIDFRVCTLHDPALYVELNEKEGLALQKKKLVPVYHHTNRHDPKYYAHPHYLEDYNAEVFQRWETWVIELDTNDFPLYTLKNLAKSESMEKSYICYYKLRPGVFRFLRQAAQLFELYLFTAGTIMHANSSLLILDPARLWFGDRVFTREDLPIKGCGSLGYKTIQRIFPGELTRHTLVTIVDDCDSVWAPETNILRVYAYHWWPDPTLHPLLLLYYRRTMKSAGSHSHVPVGILDVDSYTRLRAVSAALLNFLPSVVKLCRSPRIVFNLSHCSSALTSRTYSVLAHASEISEEAINEIRETSAPDTNRCTASIDPEFLSRKRLKLESQKIESETYHSKLSLEEESNHQAKAFIADTNRDNETTLLPKKTKTPGRHDSRFGLPEGDETINETNARVLLAATEDWEPPTILKDTDRQLSYLFEILSAMHKVFFSQLKGISSTEYDNLDIANLPNVKEILNCMRSQILKGVKLKCTGIREASIPNFQDTDLGKTVKSMGGEILGQHDKQPATHLVVGRDTAYYATVRKQESFQFMPHIMWIEAALFTFRHVDEKLFDPSRCEKEYRVFWDALQSLDIEPFESDKFLCEATKKSKNYDDLELRLFEDMGRK